MSRCDEEDRLRYCGVVELGFRAGQRQLLMDLVQSIGRETSPFADAILRGALYAEPHYVAEVRFLEGSERGTLRHASLQRVAPCAASKVSG